MMWRLPALQEVQGRKLAATVFETLYGLLVSSVSLFAIGCLWTALSPAQAVTVGIRWLALVVLAFVGIRNSSLTLWIFVAMLVGLEIGLDSPGIAAHLRVLSDIFLRLIKVIVAPLILGTLITGIAGHGDLRKLGRIGLKSLVYFEVVTTIALFIGVGAINLSKAGVGLVLPPVATEPAPQTAAASPRWEDFVLHISRKTSFSPLRKIRFCRWQSLPYCSPSL